jgi:hypothetical protein
MPLEVYAANPDRFRLVKPVDPTDPAVFETIADWSRTRGTVGIRIFLRDQVSTDPANPAINRVLATAAQYSPARERRLHGTPRPGPAIGSSQPEYADGD